MIRQLLLAAGGGGGEPAGPLPPDPTLTDPRHVTQLTGLSQNTRLDAGARTWRTEYRAQEDFTTLTIAYGATGQGTLDDPATGAVSIETPSGALVPVTWDGQEFLTLAQGQVVESDEAAVTIGEGEVFWLRVHVPAGVRWTVTGPVRPTTHMVGDHRTGAWTPAAQPGGDYPESPTPLALIGKTRPDVVCPAMLGDSICAMGAADGGWWRTALETAGLTGLSYGRNAYRFTGIDGRAGNTLRAATHVLVQYGANDVGDNQPVATMWANAVACYTYVDDLNPGIGIWQTTCTPTVSTTDGGTSYAGQNLTSTIRLSWNAFLRDGAPCHPDTKAALAVGASGIRAGDAGHPLQGVVDVAAATEQGGSSAPTGKWLIEGGSYSTDGIHPTGRGQDFMAPVVTAWLDTLTA